MDTTLQDLEKRVAALEADIRRLKIHVRMPFGKFAEIGGVEILPAPAATEGQADKPPIDFTSIGGVRVG